MIFKRPKYFIILIVFLVVIAASVIIFKGVYTSGKFTGGTYRLSEDISIDKLKEDAAYVGAWLKDDQKEDIKISILGKYKQEDKYSNDIKLIEMHKNDLGFKVIGVGYVSVTYIYQKDASVYFTYEFKCDLNNNYISIILEENGVSVEQMANLSVLDSLESIKINDSIIGKTGIEVSTHDVGSTNIDCYKVDLSDLSILPNLQEIHLDTLHYVVIEGLKQLDDVKIYVTTEQYDIYHMMYDTEDNIHVYLEHTSTECSIVVINPLNKEDIRKYKVEKNATITLETPNQVTGYHLEGFVDEYQEIILYKDELGNLITNYEYLVTRDIVLTINYVENVYKIHFDSNAPSGLIASGEMADLENIKYNQEINLPKNDFEIVGSTFDGWFYFGNTYLDQASVKSLAASQNDQEEITLKALWKENQYVVTFDLNKPVSSSSDIVGSLDDIEVKYSQEFDVASYINALTLKGWTLAGFAKQKDASGLDDLPTTFSKLTALDGETKTLYAIWQENQYDVTFDANTPLNGVLTGEMGPINKRYEAQKVLPENQYMVTGYTFIGWSLGELVLSDKDDITKLDKENPNVLKALWQENKYQLSFDLNKPENASSDINVGANYQETIENISYNEMIKLPTFSLTGWQFLGFAKNKNETNVDLILNGSQNQLGASLKDNDNVTLYAIWKANTYQVVFNALDKTSGEMEVQEFVYDVEEALHYISFIKNGYTFIGWSLSNDIEEITYSDKEMVKNLTDVNEGIVNLYAKWQANSNTKYNVHYYAENLDGTDYDLALIDPLFGVTGTNVSAEIKDFEGFSFADGNPNNILNGNVSGDESLVLKVYYSRNSYTITFNSNGGSSVLPIEKKYNDSIEAPLAPELVGYTFVGWFDEMLEEQFVFSKMPATNITLYAKWQANTNTKYQVLHKLEQLDGSYLLVDTDNLEGITNTKVTPDTKDYPGFTNPELQEKTILADGSLVVEYLYTRNHYRVLFNTNGGNDLEPIEKLYEEEFVVDVVPVKEGYSFVSWDKAIPATMPLGGIVLNAIWQVNQYKISFDMQGGTPIDDLVLDYDSDINLPSNLVRTGYLFDAWNQVVPAKMPAHDIELKATWVPIHYVVVFDSNGGTGVMDFEVFIYDEAKALNSNIYEKVGYHFSGWSLDKEATTPTYLDNEEIINLSSVNDNAIKLYAIWGANNYTIHFDINLGVHTYGEKEVLPDGNATYDQDYTLPTPVLNGWTFNYWYLLGQEENHLTGDISNLVPSGEVTLYANWSQDDVFIIYHLEIPENATPDPGFNLEAATDEIRTLPLNVSDYSGESILSLPEKFNFCTKWSFKNYYYIYINDNLITNNDSTPRTITPGETTDIVEFMALYKASQDTFNTDYVKLVPQFGLNVIEVTINKNLRSDLTLAQRELFDRDNEIANNYKEDYDKDYYDAHDESLYLFEFNITNPSDMLIQFVDHKLSPYMSSNGGLNVTLSKVEVYANDKLLGYIDSTNTDMYLNTLGADQIELRLIWEEATYQIRYMFDKPIASTNDLSYDLDETYLEDANYVSHEYSVYDHVEFFDMFTIPGWHISYFYEDGKDTVHYAIGDTFTSQKYATSYGIIHTVWEEDLYEVTYTALKPAEATNDLTGPQVGPDYIYQDIKTYEEFLHLSDNQFGLIGWKFVCWKDEKGNLYDPNHDILELDSKTITLEAVFEQIKYNINFDLNKPTTAKEDNHIIEVGLILPINNVLYEEDVALYNAESLTLDGYTFIGWSLDKDASSGVFNVSRASNIDNDTVTYYAIWQENHYNIAFDLNKPEIASHNIFVGSNEALTDLEQIETLNVSYEEIINAKLRTDLTLDGWNFLGWSLSESVDNLIGVNTNNLVLIDNGNTTLYAIWEQKTYIVKYYGFHTELASDYIKNNINERITDNGVTDGMSVFTQSGQDYVVYTNGGNPYLEVPYLYDDPNFIFTPFRYSSIATFMDWVLVDKTSALDVLNSQENHLTLDYASSVSLYANWSLEYYAISIDFNGPNDLIHNYSFKDITLKVSSWKDQDVNKDYLISLLQIQENKQDIITNGIIENVYEFADLVLEDGSSFDYIHLDYNELDEERTYLYIKLKATWNRVGFYANIDNLKGYDLENQEISDIWLLYDANYYYSRFGISYSDMNLSYLANIEPLHNNYTFVTYTINGVDVDQYTILDDTYLSQTEDLIIKAKFAPNVYQIELDMQGGANGSANIYQKYNYGYYLDADCTNSNKITNPTLNNYSFGGYYTSPNGVGSMIIDANGNVLVGNIEFEADGKLFAKWIPHIVFHSNGGSEVFDIVSEKGLPISRPTDPERAGYDFDDWYLNDTPYVFDTMPNNSIHLEAKWIAHTATPYLVAHYQENLNGSYNTVLVEMIYATTDSYVTPEPKTYAGYITPVPITTQVSGNEDTLVEYYYRLNTYSIARSTNKASISVNGSAKYSEIVKFSVSYEDEDNHSLSINFNNSCLPYYTDASCTSVTTSTSAGTFYFRMPAGSVTIAASSNGCFTGDTLIMMADGSKKELKDVQVGDLVYSWNFNEGKMDIQVVTMWWHHGMSLYNVLELEFANHETLDIVTAHGLFDFTTNKFEFIDANNYMNYINHEFAYFDGVNITRQELINVNVTCEFIDSYSLRTSYNDNAIAGGFLSLTNEDFEGITTAFKVLDDKLQYDQSYIDSLIDLYGLYEYQEWSAYMSEDIFDMFNCKYYKIYVGLGILREEDFVPLLEGLYQNMQNNA